MGCTSIRWRWYTIQVTHDSNSFCIHNYTISTVTNWNLIEVSILMVFSSISIFFNFPSLNLFGGIEKILYLTYFETSETNVSNADPWTSSISTISSFRWEASLLYNIYNQPIISYIYIYISHIYNPFSSDQNCLIPSCMKLQ